jgi:hypothetical protein
MRKKSELQSDQCFQGVEEALKRSAKNALKLARATKTPCYVIKDGKLIDLARKKTTTKKC